MYNNEEAGPAFDEFLSLIGEKVCLKGFTKYAAQLDVKSKRQPGLVGEPVRSATPINPPSGKVERPGDARERTGATGALRPHR